jgi:hypothetical protein
MHIFWNRVAENSDETLSIVGVNGNGAMCFGLEDQAQEVKVMAETRIPAGVYPIKLRTVGSFHPRYAAKFPDIHKGMLWLQDVPGFEWIYIHMGNTDDHTSGCLLVALQGRFSLDSRMTIPNSEPAYRRLYEAVVDAAEAGDLFIHVKDI